MNHFGFDFSEFSSSDEQDEDDEDGEEEPLLVTPGTAAVREGSPYCPLNSDKDDEHEFVLVDSGSGTHGCPPWWAPSVEVKPAKGTL